MANWLEGTIRKLANEHIKTNLELRYWRETTNGVP